MMNCSGECWRGKNGSVRGVCSFADDPRILESNVIRGDSRGEDLSMDDQGLTIQQCLEGGSRRRLKNRKDEG